MCIKEKENYFIDPSTVINTSIFDPIRDIATCVFCTGVVIDPLQCEKCENCFCRGCITIWKEKSNSCPFKCSEFNLKEPSRIVKIIFKLLLFKCPKNCSKEIKYEDLLTHLDICENKTINCPSCGSKVSEDVFQNKKSYVELKIENEIMRMKILQLEEKISKLEIIGVTDKIENLNKLNFTGEKVCHELNEKIEINNKSIENSSIPNYNRNSPLHSPFPYKESKFLNSSSPSSRKPFINNSANNQKLNKILDDELFKKIPFKEFKEINPFNPKINFNTHDNNVKFSYKFSCCNKYYECIHCHNKEESHVNKDVISIACYECLAVTNNINESFCDKCGNNFEKAILIIQNDKKCGNNLESSEKNINKNNKTLKNGHLSLAEVYGNAASINNLVKDKDECNGENVINGRNRNHMEYRSKKTFGRVKNYYKDY